MMVNFHRFILASSCILLTLASTGCHGAMVDKATGIDFSPNLNGLSLFGVGVRKKGPIKIYSVGMYASAAARESLTSISRTLDRAKALATLRTSATAAPPTTFLLKMNFKVGAQKMASAIADSVAPRHSGKKEDVARLEALIFEGVGGKDGGGAAVKGTTFQFDCGTDTSMKIFAVILFVGAVAGLAIEPLEEAKGRSSLDEEELLHALEARSESLEEEANERHSLDEEELLHAIEARNEALEMELEEIPTLDEEEGVESRHIVEPAPLPEERRIGAGLGVQFLGLGAGASAGLGNGGVGFNGNAGFGHNFVDYGTPAHYSQYYVQPQQQQYGPWVPVQSRRLGFGLGGNLGPIGAGASAGIGHGQVGVSGGFGFGGNYANYGAKPHYQQYYALPNQGPWFGPNQLY